MTGIPLRLCPAALPVESHLLRFFLTCSHRAHRDWGWVIVTVPALGCPWVWGGILPVVGEPAFHTRLWQEANWATELMRGGASLAAASLSVFIHKITKRELCCPLVQYKNYIVLQYSSIAGYHFHFSKLCSGQFYWNSSLWLFFFFIVFFPLHTVRVYFLLNEWMSKFEDRLWDKEPGW